MHHRTKTSPIRSRVRAAAAVAALALSAAACSSHSGHTDSSSSATSRPSGSSAAAAPSAAITQLSVPDSVGNDIDKRKEVTITACAPAAGGWGASGTATNTSGSDQTYDITIFFTTSTSSTLDYATTHVSVPAGQSADWSAAAQFPLPTPSAVRCVLRGVA